MHQLVISFRKKITFVVFYVDQLAHLLVCLVCLETMVVKNFVFRENWVGSKVAGLKTTFLPFLIQPSHFDPESPK